MSLPQSSRLVAIAGGSGSGKGWLAGRLRRLLGSQAGHLSLDDFYHDRSHLPPGRRALVNFDEPDAIDWACAERTLSDLREGRPPRIPRYDFVTHCRRSRPADWEPRPVVIVEGLWLLPPSPLARFFDLKVYLDCPPALRFERRLARDQAERERSVEDIRRQFEDTVAPMHDLHVEPQKQRADLVLTQPFRGEDILRLGERLQALLSPTAPAPERAPASFPADLLALLKP